MSGAPVSQAAFLWYGDEPKGNNGVKTTLQGKNGFLLNAYRFTANEYYYVCEIPSTGEWVQDLSWIHS